MNIYEKLLNVQTELKAPKGQYNAFGKYKYRSCEDILEALKPVLEKNKLTMYISDDIVVINERYYVKATVYLINSEKMGETIQVSALAREEETKKGMDGSQITGASSSYARKYALNGMFAIDDTKDSDSTNTHGKEKTEQEKTQDHLNSREGMIERINEYVRGEKLERLLKSYNAESLEKMTDDQLIDACKRLFKK